MRPVLHALAILGVLLSIAAIYQHVTELHTTSVPRGANGYLGALYETRPSYHMKLPPGGRERLAAMKLLPRVMAQAQRSGHFADYDGATFACTRAGNVTTCSLSKKGEPTITASGTS